MMRITVYRLIIEITVLACSLYFVFYGAVDVIEGIRVLFQLLGGEEVAQVIEIAQVCIVCKRTGIGDHDIQLGCGDIDHQLLAGVIVVTGVCADLYGGVVLYIIFLRVDSGIFCEGICVLGIIHIIVGGDVEHQSVKGSVLAGSHLMNEGDCEDHRDDSDDDVPFIIVKKISELFLRGTVFHGSPFFFEFIHYRHVRKPSFVLLLGTAPPRSIHKSVCCATELIYNL